MVQTPVVVDCGGSPPRWSGTLDGESRFHPATALVLRVELVRQSGGFAPLRRTDSMTLSRRPFPSAPVTSGCAPPSQPQPDRPAFGNLAVNARRTGPLDPSTDSGVRGVKNASTKKVKLMIFESTQYQYCRRERCTRQCTPSSILILPQLPASTAAHYVVRPHVLHRTRGVVRDPAGDYVRILLRSGRGGSYGDIGLRSGEI
jgi:hypothetical protein